MEIPHDVIGSRSLGYSRVSAVSIPSQNEAALLSRCKIFLLTTVSLNGFVLAD